MTRQFDVFPNPSKRGTEERPFVVVVQSNAVADSPGRVSVPLVLKNELHPIRRLNPAFNIVGRLVYFHPLELATIPVRLLRLPIANLERARYEIIAALDLLLTGI
jgi:toxin CcdB